MFGRNGSDELSAVSYQLWQLSAISFQGGTGLETAISARRSSLLTADGTKESIVLVELYVRNLAVIDDLRLQFRPGLTVLSGDEGAGKFLLVDALSLLLGGQGIHQPHPHGDISFYG